jgi:hypothetical protein
MGNVRVWSGTIREGEGAVQAGEAGTISLLSALKILGIGTDSMTDPASDAPRYRVLLPQRRGRAWILAAV